MNQAIIQECRLHRYLLGEYSSSVALNRRGGHTSVVDLHGWQHISQGQSVRSSGGVEARVTLAARSLPGQQLAWTVEAVEERFPRTTGKCGFHDLTAGGVNGRMLLDQAEPLRVSTFRERFRLQQCVQQR